MKLFNLSYKARFYLYVVVYSFFVLSVIYATLLGSEPLFYLSGMISVFFILAGARKLRLYSAFHRAGAAILGLTFLAYGTLSFIAADMPRISDFFRFTLLFTGFFFSATGLILVADALIWKTGRKEKGKTKGK